MRILGIGTDIIECSRIQRMIDKHGTSFYKRVYTESENLYCQSHQASVIHYSGRWAAKEAIMKALGTGWAKGVQWTDIEVKNEPGGKPIVHLSGVAAELMEAEGDFHIDLSITHCKEYAVAFAIATVPH